MKELCVVHLVRAQNGIEPFQRFLNSYKRNPGGVEHDLLVVFKGFNNPNDLNIYKELLESFNYISYEISDEGFDLTAYFAVAKSFENQYHFFCFLNSFTEILTVNWLSNLYQAALKPNIGLVGASGSWESHRSESRISLINEVIVVSSNHFSLYKEKLIWKRLILSFSAGIDYLRNQYKLSFFPNPHIRTNVFIISSKIINSLKVHEMYTKLDAYLLESGRNGISRQVLSKGMRILVVGMDGVCYESSEWNRSNIFWQSNQENLLALDNQTRDYRYGTLERRKLLSRKAWGRPVNITKNIDFNHCPKVSVCIPVHNGGKYLHATINSVLNQTYLNYELIVIDNASTDETSRLVEQFAKENNKIKFFKNEKNIGLIGNFNECLVKSTGDYIKFLCADDKLLPDCLTEMVCALNENKTANLVTVGRILINKNSDVLGSKFYSKKEILFDGKEVINRCLFGTNYIGEPSATMFRRNVVLKSFNVNFPHLVDLEMWFRLLEEGGLVNLPQILCEIRRHELQTTNNNIQTGALVEDNVKLFDLYKNRPYIDHKKTSTLERKMRIAYRVWICRNYIQSERKKEILKLQSSIVIYYLLMPIISFVLNMSRIFTNQIYSRFSIK